MTQRTSLIEQYNNRDVIAQIYRIIDIAEHGAIESLNVEKTGAIVRLLFTMHDGTVHPVEFPANGIVDITSVQDGSTMNVTITLDDGTERTISWTIVPGVTLDTAQTVSGPKTFSALMTLLSGLGITGTVTIDGDTQITNGHGLSVAGDIDSAGTLKGDAAEIRGPMSVSGQSEIAGMAIEQSGNITVLSNDNGISSTSPFDLTNLTVPTTPASVSAAVNQSYVESTVTGVNNILHKTGIENKSGPLTFVGGNNALVSNQVAGTGSEDTCWHRFLRTPKQSGARGRSVLGFLNRSSQGYTNTGFFMISYTQSGVVPAIVWVKRGSALDVQDLAVTSEGSYWTLWVRNATTATIGLSLITMVSNISNDCCYFNTDVDTTGLSAPVSDSTTSYPVDW